MFYTLEKLYFRIEELAGYRYQDSIPLSSFNCQVDEAGDVAAMPPQSGNWSQMEVGDRWQGRDLYIWLSKDITIPEEWAGRKVLGRFDFGTTGGGHNSGFESLLFINGKPFKGVDSNHQEVFFPEELTGTEVNLCFRLWSGLEGGGQPQQQEHELKLAEITCLHEAADDLYFTGKAVLETVNQLEENNPVRQQLLSILDRAFYRLDWSRPGSQEFYQSVKEGRQKLKEELQEVERDHPVTVNCIGHTHIDVAWLWRLKHTREKAARSFSTVMRLMERYPEYVFLQSQPQLYEYIKNDYPEIYQQMKDRIEEGKWEAEGGMWVEADCNLTSGESLVRQILYGKKFLKDEFGVDCKYLWLPDVFGYSWALPQILKKSGIETFMTTKISWNQYNRMPHDTFNWRGIDGTEILTHFITTPSGGRIYTYNGLINPETVTGIWDNYQDKEINQELLLSYGYGDGGGGVNREMIEMRRRLQEMPGVPNVTTGRADEYFDRLHDTVEATDRYVHTWDGELYLEYHRGTYTSQAYNKRMNRKLELFYRETEWMCALSSILENDWSHYPLQEINEGWKIILRNQFHDIIPGSSIREVYEDCHQEYSEAEAIADREWQNSAEELTGDIVPADTKKNKDGDNYVIFNSAPWEREDIVQITSIDSSRQGKWVDKDGEELVSVNTGENWLVRVPQLPAMGYTGMAFIEDENSSFTQKETALPFTPHCNGISTPYYKIKWNEKGQLISIFDWQTKRQVLSEEEKGNVFQIFEDKPMAHDAWDIDIFYQEKMEEIDRLKAIDVIEISELRAVVRCKWEYPDAAITQDMILYADNRRIDFETEVEWHVQHKLLKVAFPVDIRSTEATYDIQFGNVKRSTHWNTSWDYAQFEVVGHQWADLSETGYGVALLNDCKYGYDIKDNVMRLSLLKSATSPDIKADQGRHKFTYALLPHEGSWFEGDVAVEAWKLNNPLTYTRGEACGPGGGDDFSLFNIDVDNVMIDAVKKAERKDKLILRVHEFAGARGPVAITSDLEIANWQECNLMEEPCDNINDSQTIKFKISPYEIRTFIVDLKTKDR